MILVPLFRQYIQRGKLLARFSPQLTGWRAAFSITVEGLAPYADDTHEGLDAETEARSIQTMAVPNRSNHTTAARDS